MAAFAAGRQACAGPEYGPSAGSSKHDGRRFDVGPLYLPAFFGSCCNSWSVCWLTEPIRLVLWRGMCPPGWQQNLLIVTAMSFDRTADIAQNAARPEPGGIPLTFARHVGHPLILSERTCPKP